MGIFQNSVLRNHLQKCDNTSALHAYEVYKSDFLPKIANIKTSKEEQYQYGFLDDLFVKVLGYTLNPTPDYNLIAEQKKVTLTLIQQDEWEEYFESYQKELLEIKANIDTTDKQIDEMVYALYGLSEDEVAVVEGKG